MSWAALSRSDQQWQDQAGLGLRAAPSAPGFRKGSVSPKGERAACRPCPSGASCQRKGSPALVDLTLLWKNKPGKQKKALPFTQQGHLSS